MSPKQSSSKHRESSGDGTAFRPLRDPQPRRGQRKVAGQLALLILVLLAAAAGSLVGLMLFYSVHLPQIDDLERYRPSTTTELLDVKGARLRLIRSGAAGGGRL